MATNIFTKFKQLIPAAAMEVATVEAVNTNGTSTVTTANGGAAKVLGDTVAVGKKAVIKDGQIQGEAPDLTYYEIEV